VEVDGVIGALFKVCESYSKACLYLEGHFTKDKYDPTYESGAVATAATEIRRYELGNENLTQKKQEAARALPKGNLWKT
jgi:hypothetical protein